MNDGRLRLGRLVSVLLLAAALVGLGAGRRAFDAPEPPPLREGPARARPDGGQMLGLAKGVRPNELSRLNLGHKIDFQSARPDLLIRLPGLGRASVASGRERGYLPNHQRRSTDGLIKNDTASPPDTDHEPRSAPDDL